MNKLLDKLTEVQVMNFKKNFGWIIAIVAGTVAIASAVTAFLIFKDKKKKTKEEPRQSTIVDRNKFTNQKGDDNSGHNSKKR